MWHVLSSFIDWRAVFNALLVGVGGVSVWIFKYHYQRFMAAHDLQRKADAEWRKRVDRELAEVRRVCKLPASSEATRKGNGVHRATTVGDTTDDDGVSNT